MPSFRAGDVTQVAIIGLEKPVDLEQLTGQAHTQGPVTGGVEVASIYRDAGSACAILDPLLGRAICIVMAVIATTVV